MFAVDQKVFFKQPKKSWVIGKVVSVGDVPKIGKAYTIQDEDGEQAEKIAEANVTLCRDDLLNEGIDPIVHDLLFLTVLHDATLLRCLKVRYLKDIIYTNIGAIVVALNPFNYKIPWYLDSCMEKYMAEGDVIRTNLPHSWAVAHNTFYEMRNDEKAQCILVSGESGAGKTEACKLVMKYLCNVSMMKATPAQKETGEVVRKKVLDSSPILEGFGNAKTVRNDNSSRFGKFLKVKFDPASGILVGCFTINYLLEKSRIISAAGNERVYHSFYYLCKGTKYTSTFGLKPATEYKSTSMGKCIENPGNGDDGALFTECEQAFTTFGISEDQQQKIWAVLAGILTAQNIELSAPDKDSTIVAEKGKPAMKQSSQIWGVSEETLEKEFLTTTQTVRGETFVQKLKMAQAMDTRDSLCKHLYANLFVWLIGALNNSTDVPLDCDQWIGLLDIFGFEDFESGNSFEQICINLANETLQNHYNTFIFKRDQEECRAEGIDVTDIKCPDNSDCLRLIVENVGILGLLDEECRLGTGTDDGFLEKVIQSCSKNKFFDRKPTSRGTFIVKHYAGNVTYQVKGFLDKNRDTLKDAMKLLFRSSSNDFIAQLLPEPVEKTGKLLTTGYFFKTQVSDLMTLINSTNPHWIRCVKPHPAKKPLMFDGMSVTNQLESSGVLGTIKVRKAGYPVRMSHKAFFARYKILTGKPPADYKDKAAVNACVQRAMKLAKTTGKEVQAGTTRIFMKSEAYFMFETAREECTTTFRVQLQMAARTIVAQLVARKKVWIKSIDFIHREYRAYLARSAEVREKRRKIIEALRKQQHEERERFCNEADGDFEDLENEQVREYADILKMKRKHLEWVSSKSQREAMEQRQLMDQEKREREEIFDDFKEMLHENLPELIDLILETLPILEEPQRKEVLDDQTAEFEQLVQQYRWEWLTLFKVEIERAERRYRRMLLRLEDMQCTEIIERVRFYPAYVASVTRSARPYGDIIRRIKQYAETVALRATRRRAVKDANEDIDFFTTRNFRDPTKLERELIALEVGANIKQDRPYVRMGTNERHIDISKYPTKHPWFSPKGVPDIDQLSAGMGTFKHPKEGAKVTELSPIRKHAIHEILEQQGIKVRTTGVCDVFRDSHEEAMFLRERHMVSAEFKLLAQCKRYDGPLVKETEITDKTLLKSAQFMLETISSHFAEELVSDVRKLNAFCSTREIPEQSRVTGDWAPFSPVSKSLLMTYPVYPDWKLLLHEKQRLTYATENYQGELLKIIRQAQDRGCKLAMRFDCDAEHSVEEVHAAYTLLCADFQVCSRCLFPMAAKSVLVQLRLLWPHVQDVAFPDRCRDCTAGFFGSYARQKKA